MTKTTTINKKLGTGLPSLLRDRLSVVTGLFVLALFVVQALIMDRVQNGTRYYNYTTFRLMTFLIIFVLYLVIMGVVFLQYVYTQPGWTPLTFKQRLKNTKPYEFAIYAYILFAFISALCAPRTGYSSTYMLTPPLTDSGIFYAFWGSTDRNEGFLVLLCYALAVLFIMKFYRPKQRDFLVFTVVAVLIASYGILQFCGLDPLTLNFNASAIYPFHHIMAMSTVSNENFASTYLCLFVFITLIQFTQQDSPVRWFYFVSLLVIFFGIFIMDTESGIVGMAGALVIFFPCFVRSLKYASRFFFALGSIALVYWLRHLITAVAYSQAYLIFNIAMLAAIACFALAFILFAIHKFKSRKDSKLPHPSEKLMRIVWPVLLVLGIAGAFIIVPKIADDPSQGTLYEAGQMMRGNFDDDFGSSRIYIWNRAMSMMTEQKPVLLSKTFWLGHGPDNFYPAFFDKYGMEAFERYNVSFDKAHNEYLQMFFDIGALGTLSMISFQVLIIWFAIKRSKQPIIFAVAATCLCYMGQAFFNLSMPGVAPLAWAMWGILGALIRTKEAPEELDDWVPSRKQKALLSAAQEA